jgi:hypothetical protein
MYRKGMLNFNNSGLRLNKKDSTFYNDTVPTDKVRKGLTLPILNIIQANASLSNYLFGKDKVNSIFFKKP